MRQALCAAAAHRPTGSRFGQEPHFPEQLEEGGCQVGELPLRPPGVSKKLEGTRTTQSTQLHCCLQAQQDTHSHAADKEGHNIAWHFRVATINNASNPLP